MRKANKSKLDPYAKILAEMDGEKTLPEIRAWLKAEGCSVSSSVLSVFLTRLRTHKELQDANDLLDTFQEFTRQQNPDWSADKVRDMGIQFFMAHATAKKDAAKFATIVKLDQNERFGKSKASLEERRLALDQSKFLIESDAFMQRMLKTAADVNASNLSNAEKISAMRAEAFKSVDELQASGKIKIPKA